MPLSPLPPVIGHRCARALAPENTLAGLYRAAALGVTWVEVDVRLSADGVPVLLHDPTLDRTTNGTGAVSATPAATVRRLDAGSWFDPAFTGETVPTLDEFLATAAGLRVGVNLEIKGSADDAGAVALAALAVARSVWPSDAAPPLISSFEPAALDAAMAQSPAWPRGLLLDRLSPEWPAAAARVGAAAIIINHLALTARDTVAALAQGGRPVLAYTVNDPVRAGQLRDWGLTAVITDRPDANMVAATIRLAENNFIYGSMMTSPVACGYDTPLEAAGGDRS